MSTTDQAFIRAYNTGTAAGERPRTARSVATGQASGAAAPARHFVDAAHAGPYAPHYGDPAGDAAESPVVHEARLLAARLAKLNGAAAAGLDAATQPNETAPEFAAEAEVTPVPDALVPAYETQRFHWPRRTEVLIAAAGDEFATFADELEERCDTGRKTLLVTGAMRGEGRTTLVLALARLAANRGLRPVIVDVDLRSPQAAEQLGVRPEVGWDDAQADRLTPAEVLIESLDDHVSLLPLRSGFANPRALAGGGFLRGAVAELREHYDLVLLDVGPLGDDAETIDLAVALGGCPLDDALIVRDRRRSTPKQVHEVCRRVAALGVRHWDVVENFTEIESY